MRLPSKFTSFVFLLLFSSLSLAQTQQPPQEAGPFRPSDLVELVKLDPTIKLDIRYATKNNFLGRPVYKQARAFLQRPAAEALVRVNQALRKQGYGLVIHDGYGPWYVTKIFWDHPRRSACAICCARRWKAKGLRSTSLSGGTTIT